MIPKNIKELIKPDLIKLNIKQKDILLIAYKMTLKDGLGLCVYFADNDEFDNMLRLEYNITNTKYKEKQIIHINKKYKQCNGYKNISNRVHYKFVNSILVHNDVFMCEDLLIHNIDEYEVHNYDINFKILDKL